LLLYLLLNSRDKEVDIRNRVGFLLGAPLQSKGQFTGTEIKGILFNLLLVEKGNNFRVPVGTLRLFHAERAAGNQDQREQNRQIDEDAPIPPGRHRGLVLIWIVQTFHSLGLEIGLPGPKQESIVRLAHFQRKMRMGQ